MKLISTRHNGYNQSTHHNHPGSRVIQDREINTTLSVKQFCSSHNRYLVPLEYSVTHIRSLGNHLQEHLDCKYYLFDHHFPNDFGNSHVYAKICSLQLLYPSIPSRPLKCRQKMQQANAGGTVTVGRTADSRSDASLLSSGQENTQQAGSVKSVLSERCKHYGRRGCGQLHQ